MAPAVGQPAPAFSLEGVDGARVELGDLIGGRPVVLQLGSHTCPVFRYRRFDVEELIADYGDRVHFVVVYTREAHPVGSSSPYAEGEWVTWTNRLTRVLLEQPTSTEERVERAAWSRERLALRQTLAVDSMENEVWKAYGAASAPAFVIDRRGHVVLRQPWVEPAAIRQALEELLTPPTGARTEP